MIPTEVETLPQILRKKGYLTAGFVGGVWLSKVFGWSRGFSSYNEKNGNGNSLENKKDSVRKDDETDESSEHDNLIKKESASIEA